MNFPFFVPLLARSNFVVELTNRTASAGQAVFRIDQKRKDAHSKQWHTSRQIGNLFRDCSLVSVFPPDSLRSGNIDIIYENDMGSVGFLTLGLKLLQNVHNARARSFAVSEIHENHCKVPSTRTVSLGNRERHRAGRCRCFRSRTENLEKVT